MMKRRDFLRLGSTGLAGASIAGASIAGISAAGSIAKPDKRKKITSRLQPGETLKKGFMLETFPSDQEYTLLEKFQMLKDAGFHGVEPSSGLNRSEVLRAKETAGLEIPSVVVSTHWSEPLSSPDESVREAGLRGLETALHDAHQYGASTILLVPGIVNSGVSYDQVYRRSQNEIRKALPLAEELGITIAIENVWNHFLLSPLEAARYVDEFDSAYIGWYLDVGNIINYGWAHHWIRILGDRIAMIHIKEFSREKRDREGLRNGFRVNLLEGDNEWNKIMAAIRDVGYSGYGIAEPPYREEDIPADVWLKEYVSGRMGRIFTS